MYKALNAFKAYIPEMPAKQLTELRSFIKESKSEPGEASFFLKRHLSRCRDGSHSFTISEADTKLRILDKFPEQVDIDQLALAGKVASLISSDSYRAVGVKQANEVLSKIRANYGDVEIFETGKDGYFWIPPENVANSPGLDALAKAMLADKAKCETLDDVQNYLQQQLN